MPQSCPNLKQETDFHILKLYNNWLMVTGLGEGSINSQILSVLCISVQSDSSRAKDSSLKIYRISWLLKAPLGAMGVGLEMVKWSLSKYKQSTDIVTFNISGIDCNCYSLTFWYVNYINKFPKNQISFITRLNSLWHDKSLS